jgi:uncharacterized protein (UPF0261 family)
MKSQDAKTVYCLATLDTKGPDAEFVTHLIRGWGHKVVLLDVGTQSIPTVKPDQGRETLLNPAQITNLSRAEAIDLMSAALTAFLKSESAAGRLAGVIGMGGTGGTALICPALRALPIGLPKVMISTVASGDTRPHVGTSDIFMVYPVVDVAGLNQVSKTVYAQAAGALAARSMAQLADARGRIQWMFERATGRGGTAADIQPLQRLLTNALHRYRGQGTDKATALLGAANIDASKSDDTGMQAALTVVANAILNLDEVLMRP